jgi:rSAM/selenodomain-associated transferase 2
VINVSVVIAARNEERHVGAAIDSAFAAGAAEVIVADGASSDRTRLIARERGAVIIECEAFRARQLNRGAALAKGDAIIFLHADTTLPAGACAAVAAALADGAEFGGFRIRFAEDLFRLRYVAFMINSRTRVTRQPWGDQAQFARRASFPGFREIPLMEDYDLARRMKRRVLLPLAVTTSGRRFLDRGVIRTSIINWLLIAAFHLGVSPARLAAWYRRGSG